MSGRAPWLPWLHMPHPCPASRTLSGSQSPNFIPFQWTSGPSRRQSCSPVSWRTLCLSTAALWALLGHDLAAPRGMGPARWEREGLANSLLFSLLCPLAAAGNLRAPPHRCPLTCGVAGREQGRPHSPGAFFSLLKG